MSELRVKLSVGVDCLRRGLEYKICSQVQMYTGRKVCLQQVLMSYVSSVGVRGPCGGDHTS